MRDLAITAQGHGFTVNVSDKGIFSTSYAGEEFESETLGGLQRSLVKAIRGSRVEATYVSATGGRGIVRGYHADRREVLVTRADGSKASVSDHTHVFRAEDITEAEIDELHEIETKMAGLKRRQSEIQSKMVSIETILNDALGENLTESWGYERLLKQRAEEAGDG